MLSICIVRRAKYVTIIPVAERGERPTATARLTRTVTPVVRRWIASLRRRDARFIFFAPSKRERAENERASKDENGTSCSSIRPSHSVLRPNGVWRRRTPFGESDASARTRTETPRLARAGARTATTAEAGTSAGWTPLSQSRRRLGGEWT